MDLIPISIKLSVPGGVAIEWNDGHQAVYSYAHLRRCCPCATCERREPNVVDDEPGTLPILGQRPIRVVSASQVGRYAIQFDFSDGHKTGIYAFNYLREICPCDQCRG